MLYLASTDPQVEMEALEQAHKYVHKAGKKWQYWINGFYALGIENNTKRSLELFMKMTEEFPREKTAHLTLGWILYRRGDTDQAITFLKRAVNLDPQYSAALNLLGYAFLEKGNFEKARDYFQKYMNAYPKEPNPYDSMGDMFFAMGWIDEAQTYYRKTLQLKADFSSGRKIAYLLAVQENYPSALEAIDHYYLSKKSADAQATGYLYKGLYFYWLRQMNSSLKELSQALQLAESRKLQTTTRYARWLKIWVFTAQDRLQYARRQAKQWYDSFEQNQNVEQLFLNKLEYQFALGLIDLKEVKADSAQTRLAVMQSFLTEIKNFRLKERAEFHCQLLKGELLYQQKSYEAAIEVALRVTQLRHQAFDLDPTIEFIFHTNIPPLHDLLACVYRRQGKLQEAISAYENLMNKDSSGSYRFLVHPL